MMNAVTSKVYNTVLQFSIFVFTIALVYFAFIYYPRVSSSYKAGNIRSKPLAAPVVANVNNFPIETANFRLTFEKDSNTYYAFIKGSALEQFVANKNAALLSLKNALSTQTLCDLNIILVSAQNLKVPENFLQVDNCH